jgi:hypothetical protein
MSQALELDNPYIEVTLLNQDPDPVSPGSYVDVRFKITNNEMQDARGLEVLLEPSYPFALAETEDPLRVIGDLPNLGEDNSIIVKFKLRVAEDAIEGANSVKLSYKHSARGWISREFDLNVETVDANVAIVSVSTTPEKIKPGEKAILNVRLKNMADSPMRDVALKLDLTYAGLLSGATAKTASDSILAYNILPFAPLGSASEQKIDLLSSQDEYTFSYTIIAYSDAESKVYKIPVDITYYDELENKYTKHDVLGLVVGAKPDLSVVVEQSELYVGKKTGNVVVKFVNKGFSGVKFLDVILSEGEEFQILSSPEVYIGNVDSDDYETAEFNLYLKNGASKKEDTVPLPLKVEYRDANNNLYTEEYSLPLEIVDPNKLGIKTSSGSPVFLIVIVLGAVLFFYFRGKKKAKK